VISTVTTATVTTVTTVTAAVLGGLSLLTVVMLLGMFISKEVVSSSEESRWRSFSKGLNLALIPLLLGFLLIAAVKVLEVLH
jgi:sulfite exporter TauE/SafE